MAGTPERSKGEARFWSVAEAFLDDGTLVEGTMMGHRCLRSASTDGFVAIVERATGNLVVKLPRERVAELVASKRAVPFAPAKKVFKEWAAIPKYDRRRWTKLLEESIAFADG